MKDPRATAWIRRHHPSGECAARLVCFPYAGGSAGFFRPVSARFSGVADVVALQYPGRQDRYREACVEDLGTLADLVAGQLRGLDDKPTVFFGHSMGATLAFETAVRLEREGANPPRAVIASGRRAPSARRDERVHLRDDAGIITELEELGGTDSVVFGHDELLRLALPAIRGDYRAIETYECAPGRRVRCPITVLAGDADPRTTLEEARAWRDHTEGSFRMRVFAGGHFFLAAHQCAVNDELAGHLEAAASAHGPDGSASPR